jgi:hypothetical protein
MVPPSILRCISLQCGRCTFQCAFWQAGLQYQLHLHPPHISDAPSVPHCQHGPCCCCCLCFCRFVAADAPAASGSDCAAAEATAAGVSGRPLAVPLSPAAAAAAGSLSTSTEAAS